MEIVYYYEHANVRFRHFHAVNHTVCCVNALAVNALVQAVRVTVLGPADFGCGLSLGGVVRVRPGLANPCLLTETSSVLSQGFGIVKKVGVS